MKLLRVNSLLAIFIAIVLMSGCKKDEESSNGDYVAPTATSETKLIEVPAAIQNNTDLGMANGYIQMINGLSAFNSYFANMPAGANYSETKSSTKTWTWSNQGMTVWIELTEGTLDYTWRLYFQGGDQWLVKTKIIEATELKTGLSGSLKFYDAESSSVVLTYTWEKVGTAVNATLLYNEGYDAILITLSVSNDGSGNYNMYYGSTTAAQQIAHVQWTASGTGSWWIKDTDGTGYASGTF